MSAIQFLEKLKYFLVIKDNHKIIFQGPGNYLNRPWYSSGSIEIVTPENIIINIALMTSRAGLVANDTAKETFEKAKELGYVLRHIPTNLFQSIDNVGDIPSENLEAGVFSYVDIVGGYKKYVFAFKDFYENFPIYKGENRLELQVKENLQDKGRYAGWFRYALTIIVDQDSASAFEAFLALPYGDESIGWRGNFIAAYQEALAGDYTRFHKYDTSIYEQELDIDQMYLLLESFDTLDLPIDIILGLIDLENKINAIRLINNLKSDTTGLLKRLDEFFRDESTTIYLNYYDTLAQTYQKTLELYDTISVVNQEVAVYEEYENDRFLFMKLAIEANTYFFNNKLGSLNIDAQFWTRFNYLSGIERINDLGKIFFKYYCYRDWEFANNPHYDVNEPGLDPFDLVKLYFINGREELSKLDTKDKLLKSYLAVDANDENLQYTYLPRIYIMALCEAQQSAIISHAIDVVTLQAGAASLLKFPVMSITGALSIATVVTFSGSIVFSDPTVSAYLEENHPDFIANWNTIKQAVLILDLAHLGLFGVRNIASMVNDYVTYRTAMNQFKAKYDSFSPQLRAKLKPLMENGFAQLDLVLKEWEAYLNTVNNAFKPGWTVGRVLEDRASGIFHEPSVYLKESYINSHLAKFDNGYSFLAVEPAGSPWLTTGYPTIGPPGGKFTAAYDEMTQLLNRTNGNLAKIQDELGIVAGPDDWVGQVRNGARIIRVDLTPSQVPWSNIPKGNEGGANPLWLPGGITPKNWAELIIESIQKSTINSSQVRYITLK
ncbi:hypothetical protein [uncultured Kordia sp.]|uniref:hypothetical protein n=1 Tax=uncultured Kordia sp. TaxID=507699 RepID=UPI002601BBEC|nr:hypothetical protein [uncultured Kordia sp.]